MSRCFPYPPPGYTPSKDEIEALIGSIKLQNERQEAKEQRKREKRRKKKEKRRENKEKHKEKKHKSNGFLDKSNDHVSDKLLAEDKNIYRSTEVESEQFEGSSLTEEHAPFNSHGSSSDSFGTGNKRKRHSSHINDNGVLVRLSSEKQNCFDALANEQGPCSTSGRTEFFVRNKNDTHLRDVIQRSDEQNFSINGRIEAIDSCRPRIKSVPDALKISLMQRMAQEYKNLVENWNPSSKLQDACFYSDDMDWLFNSKNRDMPPEKRHRSESEIMSCSRVASVWPHAEYLHEVGVYALPLTIPF